MSSSVPKRPTWFEPKNAIQQDTVESMEQSFRDLDDLQTRRIDEARAQALRPMSETVRDWDSRSDAHVTGHIRPWSRSSWDRVQENTWKRKHPFLAFIKSFTSFSF